MNNWKDNFDRVWAFEDGLAPVKKDGKQGFVNKKGEVVILLIYDFVDYFNEGKAAVLKDDEWFYINKKGERIEDE